MKKRSGFVKFISFVAAAFLAVALSGCQYILPKEEEPLAPPLVKPKEIEYTTVDVVRGDIQQTVQGQGRVESVKTVDLSYTQSGGRLKSMDVKVGDTVKKGDTVAQLDTGDLDFRMQVEKLRLQQMNNNLAALKKSMSGTPDKTALKNAEIDVKIEQLTLQQLQTQKDSAVLRAPLDGVVLYVSQASLGDPIEAYSTLVQIADLNTKMLAYVKDSYSTDTFQIGMKVQVTMESTKKQVEGEVVATPPDMEQKDKSKPDSTIYIRLPDDVIQSAEIGDDARVVLIVAERKGVLKLPRNVVRTYQQRRYVQALVNGVKVEKDVQVGLETKTECEIVEGLAEGDKVIAG